jgi:phosphatidylglycerol---prolipoprotein diacylglyceryl transferase
MLPILYQNFDFILYSYPLFMGLGWGIAYQIYFSLISTDFPRRFSYLLFWGIFFFAWPGAKLLFYFTMPPEIETNILAQSSFWMGGGFVFYGGLAGGLLFLLLFQLAGNSLSVNTIWPMVPALTIGHGIGRIGCALAGCCYGKVTDWKWAIHLHGYDRHPTQLLEASALLLLGFYLLKSSKPKKLLIAQYLLAYGFLRIGIELLRGDVVRGLWGPLTPSQWISIGLIFGSYTLFRKHFKFK